MMDTARIRAARRVQGRFAALTAATALTAVAAFVPASGAASAAQTVPRVPATNDVAACTLLTDPTAQRSCVESAQQRRAATAFDPSATRARGPSARPQVGDLSGLRRSAKPDGRRKGGAPGRDAGAAAAADQPQEMP